MIPIRAVAAVSLAILVTACASPGPMGGAVASSAEDAHTAHPPEATPGAAVMEPRMKAMQEMHQKMANARTPAEREGLIAEHMKAMQGGMAMMREMHGLGPMGGKPMPSSMGDRDQMMAEHMAMMQMMMSMMADRMPAAPVNR